MTLIDTYTKHELIEIVKTSKSMKDVIRKLGYSTTSGNNHKTVKNRLQKYNIDISHFTSKSDKIKRSPENIFIENSSAVKRFYGRTIKAVIILNMNALYVDYLLFGMVKI